MQELLVDRGELDGVSTTLESLPARDKPIRMTRSRSGHGDDQSANDGNNSFKELLFKCSGF